VEEVKFGVVGLCQTIVTCGDLDLENFIFFEDGLPPPALHDTTGCTDDADEHLKQTRPMDRVSPQTIPTQAHALSPVRMPTTDSNMVDALPAPQHPRLVICLPGRHMDLDRGALHHQHTPSNSVVVASSGDSDSDDGVVFDQPIHNIAHVPDYLERMLRSGQGTGRGMVVLLASSTAEMGVVTPCLSLMTVKASITLQLHSWPGCLAAFIFCSSLEHTQGIGGT